MKKQNVVDTGQMKQVKEEKKDLRKGFSGSQAAKSDSSQSWP